MPQNQSFRQLSATTTAAVATIEKMTIHEAQDSIAATIPEIEKLAWRLFAIARDLKAPLDDETLADQEPGADHLRYFTALGAMAGYTALLEQIPHLRLAAERNDSDLREEWQRREASASC